MDSHIIYRPSGMGAPEVPFWKGDDEEQILQPEEAGKAGLHNTFEYPLQSHFRYMTRCASVADLSAAEAEIERPIEHDDMLGEPILEEEEIAVQQEIMKLMYQVTTVSASIHAIK